MDDEIQLISDGDGLAVIGDPAAVGGFCPRKGCHQISTTGSGLPLAGG